MYETNVIADISEQAVNKIFTKSTRNYVYNIEILEINTLWPEEIRIK